MKECKVDCSDSWVLRLKFYNRKIINYVLINQETKLLASIGIRSEKEKGFCLLCF